MCKLTLFNLSALPIAIFLFELFSLITHPDDNVVYTGTYADNPAVSGKKMFLGYGPKQDTSFQVTAIRKNNDSLIYAVQYSFEDGRRFIENNNDTSSFHVSFLGGSHLFGDGLNDNQTTPYLLNEYSNRKYNSFNYAFSGYGAHQALMTVEKEIVNTIEISNRENVVIYYFIPSHIDRAAGKAIWDVNGPHYEFINNELVYLGGFDEGKILKENFVAKRVRVVWRNSYLSKLLSGEGYSNNDIIRTKEIIKRMNHLLLQNDTRFIVLIRKEQNTEYLDRLLYAPIIEAKIEVYFVDSIIKDYYEGNDKYKIIGDGHPNEIYNKKIANFLNKQLMQNVRD